MRQSIRRPEVRIRVLIVTADNMTSEMLRKVFAHRRKGFSVETMTGSSQTIIRGLGEHKANVALISADLQDGPHTGGKVLQELQNSHPTPAVMLMQSSKPEFVVNAFRAGARGIFYRTHSLKALSKCIRMVHKGQFWVSNEDINHLIMALTNTVPLHLSNREGIPLLTRREEDVVRLAVDGLKNREIAQRLQVKEHSIRNYMYRIFEKLGVSSRAELILFAYSQLKAS